jgi:hypothetical protein
MSVGSPSSPNTFGHLNGPVVLPPQLPRRTWSPRANHRSLPRFLIPMDLWPIYGYAHCLCLVWLIRQPVRLYR